jgi:hypothetical protein
MATVDTADFVDAEDAEVSSYPVNLRITVPFPRRFLITLIVGAEKRSPARLRAERARHPVNTWGNLTVTVAACSVITIATLFVAFVAAAL